MFKKILVAVGGSDASLEPARVGGRLAAELGAELVIVTARQDPSGVLGEPFYSQTLDHRLDDTDHILANARRVAEEQRAKVSRVESIDGGAAQSILAAAEHGDFTLIVVGTRGRNRLESALLGSVSASVAAHSHVPVLVVPATVTEEVRQPAFAYAAG
jgi:nucleotide-binding universal stress UspA family protein